MKLRVRSTIRAAAVLLFLSACVDVSRAFDLHWNLTGILLAMLAALKVALGVAVLLVVRRIRRAEEDESGPGVS